MPAYFKIIGLVLIVLAILSPIAIKTLNLAIVPAQKEVYKVFSLNILILGLFFVAWSKDKVENELTHAKRFRALVATIWFSIILLLIHPFIDILFKDPIQELSGQQVVINQLLFFLVMYYIFKPKR